MSQVRLGLLIAIIVFAAFAAYAFLAPATYRTSALLVVEPASSGAALTLPEPLEAARRLSESVLDRAMLEQLSKERAGSAAPDVQARAATSVRESLTIDTSDARSFSINYKDSDKQRAQRACNQITHHAVERAPLVLVDQSARSAVEQRRQQQTQELAAFIALHPQVAAESPPATPDLSPDKDPATSAFHAEKANLEKKLAELDSGAKSDNPYTDPAEADPKLLRRRLTEINTALNARRDALAAKPSTSSLSPELRAEWKRLLDAVTKSSAEAEAQGVPGLTARVATEAPLPGSPIDPNRTLLLFFGIVFGGGLGAAYTLVARAAQQRRSKSSRPPKPGASPSSSTSSPPPTQLGLTVVLPAAPAVPRDLGPAVPTPPAPANANLGPPIVPIPQRPISSSPPGPAPAGAPALTSAQTGAAPLALPAAPSSEPKVHQAEVVPPGAGDVPHPAPRRFASTLVLPPSENPTPPAPEDQTPDPVLASAARAWDDQIRAHEVPGFAVVRPRSEPPPSRTSSSAPPPAGPPAFDKNAPPVAVPRPISSNPPPAATINRSISRPPSAMKVTQPLGSFLPDGVWNDPSAGLVRSRTPQTPGQSVHEPSVPRSPVPQAPGASTYSYVSKPPSAPAPAPAAAPAPSVVTNVQPAPNGWRPDAALNPALRRPICEQLYPLAVERCVVVLIVGTPDASEQKSRVAAELALALAESGHPRILLLEADLQGPRVHQLIGVDMPIGSGFSQQLRARVAGAGERRWTVVGCSKTLHVLAEGMMRSPGLLLSQPFSDSLRDLRTYYDVIVIDGPTASLQIESQALDAVTDGVVFVTGRSGVASLPALEGLFREKGFRSVVSG